MNEYLDIFEESTCPSMEVLDHYLAHGLKTGEQQKIEAHLVDCPLCADALEGLSMVQDKQDVSYRIKRIKKLNQQRLLTVTQKSRELLSKRQSRVKPIKIAEILIAAAASIAILIATIFVIFQTRQNAPEHLAENKSMPIIVPVDSATTDQLAETLFQTDSIIEKSDSEILNKNENVSSQLLASNETSKQEILQMEPRQRILTNRETPLTSVQSKNSDLIESNNVSARSKSSSESLPVQQKRKNSIAKPVFKLDKIMPPDSLMEMAEFDTKLDIPEERRELSLMVDEEAFSSDELAFTHKENKKLAENTSARSSVQMQVQEDKGPYNLAYGEQTRYEVLMQLMKEGKSYYRQSRYEEANSRFEEVLESDLKNLEAQYYLGMTLFEQGKTKDAVKILKKVENEAKYREETQWKLVKAYTQLQKPVQLRKVLREIVKDKGKYAQAATELLKEEVED